MVVSQAQRKASKKYQLNNTKCYSIQLSKKYDADIITQLENVPNKTQYIKELIRQDIEKQS